VARAHGLKGQVVVELVTNRLERVAPGSLLHSRDGRVLKVTVSAPAGQAGGGRSRWVVTFAGVTGRDAADGLRGTTLLAEPIDDPRELWVHRLVGAAVVDAAGAAVGTVTAVRANPASDLLELDTGALVPLAFVTSSVPGLVTIDPPPGLLYG
jgi:16S rRNA processing protein RimM